MQYNFFLKKNYLCNMEQIILRPNIKYNEKNQDFIIA